MDTLNEKVKKLGRMIPASELSLFDTGGYLMNKARWKNRNDKERRNRKTEKDFSGVTRDRNKAGRGTGEYKTVKQKEL